MADQSGGMPKIPFSLATLINRVRGTDPAQYSYAQSRLGRQPMVFSKDAEQFKQLRGDDYGATFPPGLAQRAQLATDPTAGPLADPVRALLGETGQPVSVVAPYQKPTSGQAGSPGTEPGVPLHEAVHQYLGDHKIPAPILFTQLSPAIRDKMRQALDKRNYSGSQYADEIPARLASGQYASLGLSAAEGQQAWSTYLSMLQKVAPDKAQRLQMYTRGRQPVTSMDESGREVNAPGLDVETGIRSPQQK